MFFRYLSGLCVFLAVFGACAPSAFAQLEVYLKLSPTRAVLYEPVIAEVRIRNNTAQTIVVDDTDGDARLWILVEQGARPARQLVPRLLRTPLTLAPREITTHRINISRDYDMRATGPFTVSAFLEWNGRRYSSAREFVDVVPGLEMLRMETVLAGGSGRSFRLMTVNRDMGEDILLRIDDDRANICYTVYRLGRLLRVHRPQMEVDTDNNVAILHQAGPGRYFYHVFDPNGNLITQRAYTSEDPGVELVPGDRGRYIVSGASSSLSDAQ
jgi:hypothetical protein